VKIVTQSPQLEPVVRRKAAKKNAEQVVKPEASAQGPKPRLRAPNSQQSHSGQDPSLLSPAGHPSSHGTQQRSDEDRGPGFYRFKSPNEFPSRTQRALGAYQSNQNTSPLSANGGVVEVKSNIDTFV